LPRSPRPSPNCEMFSSGPSRQPALDARPNACTQPEPHTPLGRRRHMRRSAHRGSEYTSNSPSHPARRRGAPQCQEPEGQPGQVPALHAALARRARAARPADPDRCRRQSPEPSGDRWRHTSRGAGRYLRGRCPAGTVSVPQHPRTAGPQRVQGTDSHLHLGVKAVYVVGGRHSVAHRSPLLPAAARRSTRAAPRPLQGRPAGLLRGREPS
jgi:hypothetical protein